MSNEIVRILLRGVATTLNDRFKVIEDLMGEQIHTEKQLADRKMEDRINEKLNIVQGGLNELVQAYNKRFSILESLLEAVVRRMADAEKKTEEPMVCEPVPGALLVNIQQITLVKNEPAPSEIEIHARTALAMAVENLKTEEVIAVSADIVLAEEEEEVEVEEEEVEVEEEVEEVVEVEVEVEEVEEEVEEVEEEVEEVVEEVEEVVEVEEEEEEVVEEEGEELQVEEFKFRGKIYYRDNEMQIYDATSDGDIGEVIGIWDEKLKKIRFSA